MNKVKLKNSLNLKTLTGGQQLFWCHDTEHNDTQHNDTQQNSIKHCDINVTSVMSSMEQHAFKNVNNCLNTNIYSYLETPGVQKSNL
jgi:hypothetical protein